MTQLDDQWIILEPLAQGSQVPALFAIVLERPGKLDQHSTQLPDLHQRVNSLAERPFIFASELVALVCEDLMQLGRKNEIRIMCDAFQPGSRRAWSGWIIEAAIDFSGIEIFGDQRQRIELRAGAFGIDASSPISIRPTGRTDRDVSESAHASDFVRQTSVCRTCRQDRWRLMLGARTSRPH